MNGKNLIIMKLDHAHHFKQSSRLVHCVTDRVDVMINPIHIFRDSYNSRLQAHQQCRSAVITGFHSVTTKTKAMILNSRDVVFVLNSYDLTRHAHASLWQSKQLGLNFCSTLTIYRVTCADVKIFVSFLANLIIRTVALRKTRDVCVSYFFQSKPTNEMSAFKIKMLNVIIYGIIYRLRA